MEAGQVSTVHYLRNIWRHTNEHLQAIRELRIARELVASIENGHLAHFFKRSGVITQLVKKDTQCPDIALLINWLFPIDINHLRTPILERGMPLNVILDQSALGGRGSRGTRGSSRTKITQFVERDTSTARYEDVLNLKIPVQQGRFEIVHARHTFRHVGEDLDDLGLRQPILESRVHKINKTPSRAELHEKKDLITTSAQLRRMGVNVLDNMPVTLELLHRLDLRPHIGERGLVRNSHPLQHSRFGAIDGMGQSHDVDMGETAF